MKIESHIENLQESIQIIETAVRQGLTTMQRSIGFHSSAGALDMLEIILHKNNLIDAGFIIKHEWLKSERKIKENIPFDFPRKEEILTIITRIESIRNRLCYGKRLEEQILEKVILDFNLLKIEFQEVTGYEL